MGRDKPKKYNKMGYFQKQAYHDEQAKKYGINKDDFNTAQGGGGGRYDHYDEGAYQKAIKNAMRNDFDYRTSAQHMDGVKGEASFDDFVKYERGAVKLHKQAGNGGEYSSNKDITGVTNNLVNDYRKTMASKDDLNGMRKELEDNSAAEAEERNQSYTYESSDKVAKAQERLDKYKIEIGKGNIFGDLNADPPRADDQKDAASTFASGYAADVKSAANLKENKARNLNNAINTVRSSYRDQFM